MVISPFLLFALGTHGMDTTQDFGFIRCVYGFSAGVLCFHIYKQFEAESARQITKADTLLEVLGVIGIVIFVQSAGRGTLTFVAPFIFGFSVIVFARERGFISRALYSAPFVVLGSLSYSIYMVHFFIQGRIRDGGYLLERLLDIHIFTDLYLYNGKAVPGKLMLGTELWQGDLACVIMLLCVITISFLTHRFVEEPGRVCCKYIAKKYSKLAVLPAQPQPTAAAPVAH
jgi:peptidoglycan/LPS O-acetylase OafA/YrhL